MAQSPGAAAKKSAQAATANAALQPLLLPRDSLKPPSAEGPRIGLLLSLLAHAALIVALALGVQWHTEEPAGVTAELWAAVPQFAAPRATEAPSPQATATPKAAPPAPQPTPQPPPPPPPPPREADIAVEKAPPPKPLPDPAQAERERAERLKAEKLKAEQEAAQQREQARDQQRAQAAAEAKERKLQEQKQAQARADYLKHMLGQVDATGSPQATGNAARDAGPSASYAGRIKGRIKPNIVLTDEIPGNPTADVEVRCAPDGTIIGRRIVKSSGVKEWDDTVLRAIDRTAVLPRDTDGRIPSTLVISFKPLE
jgi:colicin import membrane protein